MRRRPSFHRVLSLLVAALQLSLLGALVLDARLDAAQWTTAAAPHVEERTSPSCPRVHPSDCALCRHLTTAARVDAAHGQSIPAPRACGSVVAKAVRPTRTAGCALPPVRAPPRA